jgi:hypothetical protein
MRVDRYTLDEFSSAFMEALEEVTSFEDGQDFIDYSLDIVSRAKEKLARGSADGLGRICRGGAGKTEV